MTAQFRWGPLAHDGPPAPLVELTISSAHHRTRTIRGLLDSGADWTTLRLEWKEALRVRDSECVEQKMVGICGPDNPITGLITVLDGLVDGRSFRIPVAFVKEVPVDLIGRLAVLEHFRVDMDGAAGLTTFEWVGLAAPLTDLFEAHWKDELAKAKEGK